MSNCQVIIFDLGNVIFRISFDRMFQYWARIGNSDVRTIQKNFVFDEMYCRFERGEISRADFRKYARDKTGLTISDSEFDTGWNDLYLEVLPGIEDLLTELKSGYRLAVLTNTNAIHAEKWRVKYATVLTVFEKVFCSFEMGARKPEKAVYQKMLDVLRIDPDTAVLFDDNPVNVQGAVDCGMQAIKVNTCLEIENALGSLGIMP
ncbi:MAG: hypothetical protein E3J78_03775 [Candidatus Cloacimonadota bacterium]|nr:MAG: hypothetical protein E3J78_03775 [Candidatus Cloacimonadota bacterium]